MGGAILRAVGHPRSSKSKLITRDTLYYPEKLIRAKSEQFWPAPSREVVPRWYRDLGTISVPSRYHLGTISVPVREGAGKLLRFRQNQFSRVIQCIADNDFWFKASGVPYSSRNRSPEISVLSRYHLGTISVPIPRGCWQNCSDFTGINFPA